jgi:hypothetical protein
MFSGGDFQDGERWLRLFANAHAKRESPRIEAVIQAREEEHVYRLRLRLDERLSPAVPLEARTVLENRGSLAWCESLALRVRGWARDLLAVPESAL